MIAHWPILPLSPLPTYLCYLCPRALCHLSLFVCSFFFLSFVSLMYMRLWCQAFFLLFIFVDTGRKKADRNTRPRYLPWLYLLNCAHECMRWHRASGAVKLKGNIKTKKGKWSIYTRTHTHTYIYIYTAMKRRKKKQGRGNKRKSRGLSYFSFRSHGSTRHWWVTWCLLVCFSRLFFFLSLVLSDGGVFNCTWLCRFFVVFFCLLLSFFCSSLLNPQQRAIEVKNTNTHTQRHTNTTAKGKKYMKWTTIGQRLSAHVYTWTARPPFEMSQH